MGWYTFIDIYFQNEIEFDAKRADEQMEDEGVIIEGFGYMEYQYTDPLKMWVSIKYGSEGEIITLLEYLTRECGAKITKIRIEDDVDEEFQDWKESEERINESLMSR